MSDHDGERSLGQRITSGAVGLSLMMVATGFLGYLHDKGNEKVDAGLRERMTDTQLEVIRKAAASQTCEMIHPRFQRICVTEERKIEAGAEGADGQASVHAVFADAYDGPG